MNAVLRGAVVYFALWLILRMAGKRALAELTTFDFIVLLIISETTQQALVQQDYSLTNSLILILTLLGLDIGLSLLKRRWPRFDRVMEGAPLLLIEDGRLLDDRIHKARVDYDDILSAARKLRGLERLDQIKYAVLEPNGGITIIPK